jgi:hypothetical protein
MRMNSAGLVYDRSLRWRFRFVDIHFSRCYWVSWICMDYISLVGHSAARAMNHTALMSIDKPIHVII